MHFINTVNMSSSSEAVKLVEEIETSFLKLIAYARGKDESITGLTETIASAANDLEIYLNSVSNPVLQTPLIALKQEVSQLEQEIEEKDRLLAFCDQRVKEWKAACIEAKSVQNHIFDFDSDNKNIK
mmetsp:Transcript_31169/g.56595  ORF Transcript_31169/g.56595 Transcript_31169/m.56595 type:complete len:127 (-) Transcript_31169:277-657(-)